MQLFFSFFITILVLYIVYHFLTVHQPFLDYDSTTLSTVAAKVAAPVSTQVNETTNAVTNTTGNLSTEGLPTTVSPYVPQPNTLSVQTIAENTNNETIGNIIQFRKVVDTNANKVQIRSDDLRESQFWLQLPSNTTFTPRGGQMDIQYVTTDAKGVKTYVGTSMPISSVQSVITEEESAWLQPIPLLGGSFDTYNQGVKKMGVRLNQLETVSGQLHEEQQGVLTNLINAEESPVTINGMFT